MLSLYARFINRDFASFLKGGCTVQAGYPHINRRAHEQGQQLRRELSVLALQRTYICPFDFTWSRCVFSSDSGRLG